jgi:hypothetical protein
MIGNEAEMDRLRGKAEEAMANDDPEGAAMNMGRAALMAKLLAKTHHEDVSAVRLFQGAETLFRSQEHGYRTKALFRRALSLRKPSSQDYSCIPATSSDPSAGAFGRRADPLARRGCSRSASSTDCKYAYVGLTSENPRRASVSNASRRHS